jgi:hypothetical protein
MKFIIDFDRLTLAASLPQWFATPWAPRCLATGNAGYAAVPAPAARKHGRHDRWTLLHRAAAAEKRCQCRFSLALAIRAADRRLARPEGSPLSHRVFLLSMTDIIAENAPPLA